MSARTLYIPSLGDSFTLAQDWTFTAVNDRRNSTVIDWAGKLVTGGKWYDGPLGPTRSEYVWVTEYDAAGNPTGRAIHQRNPAPHLTTPITLPKGTVLKIDRIYIRKGQEDFDSVTFVCPGIKVQTPQGKKMLRFFASLADVNTMVVEA